MKAARFHFILTLLLLAPLYATCNLSQGQFTPEPPLANPPGDLTTQPISVTLSSGSTGTIYYTTNGEVPSQFSHLYNPDTGIYIDRNTTLKAMAWCGDKTPPSTVTNFQYSFWLIPSGFHPEITNTIRMDMVLVPPLPDSNKHFYIGKYEVTQSQWQSIMVSNPAKFKNPSGPIETISWKDAQAFIQKLNEREETTHYRLPTLAEWFHAARAGTRTNYYFGQEPSQLKFYAWYGQNSNGLTQGVGGRLPNSWGLFDIHGNVREWVQDAQPDNLSYHYNANCGYNNKNEMACFAHQFTPNVSHYTSSNLGFRLVKEAVLPTLHASPDDENLLQRQWESAPGIPDFPME